MVARAWCIGSASDFGRRHETQPDLCIVTVARRRVRIRRRVDTESSGNLWTSAPGFQNANVTGYSHAGGSGQFVGNFTNAAAPTPDSLVKFFCVEIAQFAAVPGPVTYALDSSAGAWSGATVYNDLRKLYDIAYPNPALGDFLNGASQTAFGTSPNLAAAFQLAVWEIVFDTGLDLKRGVQRPWWIGRSGAGASLARRRGLVRGHGLHELEPLQAHERQQPGLRDGHVHRPRAGQPGSGGVGVGVGQFWSHLASSRPLTGSTRGVGFFDIAMNIFRKSLSTKRFLSWQAPCIVLSNGGLP